MSAPPMATSFGRCSATWVYGSVDSVIGPTVSRPGAMSPASRAGLQTRVTRRGDTMTEPVTSLDDRFSDPAASATSWEATVRALEAGEIFWITTVRGDGRPHVTPLVAVWLDGALHFCTGG